MNLLLNQLPQSIIDVHGSLYFDSEDMTEEDAAYEGECYTYAIATDFRSILEILIMCEDDNLSEQEKAYCCVVMLYGESYPDDVTKAYNKAKEFIECGSGDEGHGIRHGVNQGRLYSWEQEDRKSTRLNSSH